MSEAFPLSPQQAHIRDREGDQTLAVTARITIEGPVDRARLDEAIADVVADHEILRTSISDLDGTPVQRIGDDSILDVEWTDRPNGVELALSIPAVCADVESVGEIVAEIARRSGGTGEAADDEGPMQYADVAAWQLELLEDEGETAGRQFWARRTLPAGDPATAYESATPSAFTPAAIDLALNDSVVTGVHGLAEALGVDAQDVWLTAWAALLVRLVEPDHRDEVVIGVERSGRDLEELCGAIGPLTRQLPHAFGARGPRSFTDAVREVHEDRVEATKWQAFFRWPPVADGDRRSCAYAFALTSTPGPIEVGGVKFVVREQNAWIDRNRLRLQIARRNEHSTGRLHYDAGAISEIDARRVAACYAALVAGAIAEPNAPLETLPLLDPAEYERMVVDFNATQADYPSTCIHEQIEAQVTNTPDAVAIRAGETAVTYAELDVRANRLAHHLQSLGVTPGALVAIALERSPEMVVAILGVLKAGGAYVPIDPDYPEERIHFVLEQTSAAVVLTRETHAASFAPATHVVCFDRDADAIAAHPDHKPESTVKPSDLVYVIYTSGSTGRPKGVMISHEGLVISNQARIAFFGGAVGTFLLLSPLAFDSSVVGIYWTLLTGGTLLLVPKETQQAPDRLAATIEEHGVTHLLTLPSFYALVLEHGTAERLVSLKCAIVAGEACPKKLIEQHRAMLPRAGMFSEYGATETTVWASGTDCLTQTLNFAALGVPIQNAQMYVLDDALQPLPVGVPGEVHFGGPAVAPGYLNRPDLTEERFVPDPFREGGRLYKSGDLARHVATGEIEFLGRIDNQVKIRGFRVELEEIDSVLTQHPSLREAIVDARAASDDGVSKRLVGYVARYPGKDVTTDELKTFLAETLPDYMVPAQWVSLAELPKTPNGKVDRRALPDPEHVISDAFEAPTDAREQILASIWSELLGVEHVGRGDNFFELGGDSILSIQVVARAKRAGLEISARDVFQYQTVAELAEHASGDVTPTDAEQGTVEGDVELTPIQRWFFERELDDPHHANMSLLFQASEPIDVERLRRAGQALLDHHDALRMRFVREGDRWRQTDAAAETLVLEVENGADAARIEARSAETQASLDLANGPLFRLHVFDPASDAPRVLIAVHHLVFDGVAWRVLLEDLHAAYRGTSLAPKTTSFQHWASRLVAFARGDESGKIDLAAERAHWLTPIPTDVAALPLDTPDGADDNTVGTQHILSRTLDRDATEALLHEVPRTYQTRIDDILVTALLQTLTAWIGSNRIRLDLEGHGREDILEGVDLSRTIGWFTTTFPATLELPTGDDVGAAINAVKGQLRAIPNHGIGYGLLRYLRDDADARALGEHPAALINYNYLGQFDQVMAEFLRPASESAGPDYSPGHRRSHQLEACGLVVDGCLRLDWTYSDRLHREETIAGLADAFTLHLRALIEHCTAAESDGFAPSDFGDFDNVQDFYTLSPLQQGLLFHSLAETEQETYYEGFLCTLRGRVDVGALRRAWQRVTERYAILRTFFVWEGVKKPAQVVSKRVDIEIIELDWRDVSPDDRNAKLVAFKEEQRRLRFDLTAAPLYRLTLIHHADDEHTFVWGFHHLIMDGWSMFIVLEESFKLYDAFTADGDCALPRPPAYRDYIKWVCQRDPKRAEAFWRERLRGFAAPTPLMVDRPGDAHGSEQGLRQRKLSAEATRRLEALAREQRVTLNAIIQGAWGLLLHRYSGEDDVVFGSTVSGRPGDLSGVERMVGLFINTQPVRMQIDPERPFVEWLRDSQADQAEALEFDYVALGEVQSWSELTPGQNLFDTIFIFENYLKDTPIEAMSRTLGIDEVDWDESTNFAIRSHAMPGEQIELSLLYARERLDEPTIDRMLGHWITVLEQMASKPDATIGALAIVDDHERQSLLAAGRASASFDGEGRAIHQLFEAQATARPDAIAATCGDDTLTYAALDQRANQLGHRLRSLGVGPGKLVGLATDRSLDTVIGILGILKAGGAYVPLDPTYPADRLAFMIEDSGVHAMVTQRAFRTQVPHDHTVVLDEDDLSGEATTAVESGVAEGDLCYIIYTSGSTGTPKGVMVPHRSVVRLFHATHPWFGFDDSDVWTLFHSYAFDFSVWELWGALIYGGKVVVIPYAVSRAPDQYYRLLREERVTVLNQTPSAFYQLIRTEEQEGIADDLALRWVVFGGEALDIPRLKPWFDRHGDTTPQLVNMYGITETTVHVTYRPVNAGDAEAGVGSLIGEPIPDLDLYVLDDRMQPVPIGVVGELFVGGAGVTCGYLNRTELSAERFVPDPFRGGDARLYKTGDIGRRTAGGDLEYLGRNDQQIQLRGFRVELGEIESALAAHDAVREAVVLAREDEPGDLRLVAYLIAADAAPPGMGDLREFLLHRLPDYMVPVAAVWLDAFPLTGNGKLDRRALPAPDATRPTDDEAYVAPRTPSEETLANIWANVLGLERVGVEDNFFEIGGDSIRTIQIISRATEAGLKLTPMQLFQHQTVAALARAADAGSEGAARTAIDGTLPLTPAQASFFARRPVEPYAWSRALLVEVDGTIDDARLEHAARALLQSHDGLRVRFARDGDAWSASIAPVSADIPARRIDLSGVDAVTERRAIDAITDDARSKLDPESGELVQIALFDRGADRPAGLLLVAHDLAADDATWPLLLDDLRDAIASEDALAPTTYAKWATALGSVDAPAADATDAPQFPADRPDAAAHIESTDAIEVPLDAESADAFFGSANDAYHTDPLDLLTAALLRAHGTPLTVLLAIDDARAIDGEDAPDRTSGAFAAPLAIVLDAPSNDLAAHLKRTKEQLRAPAAIADHAEIALRVTDVARLERSWSAPLETAQGMRRAPIELDVERRPNGAALRARFARDRYDAPTIEALLSRVADALRATLEHCRAPDAGGFTPSDFPDAGLDQGQLDDLLGRL